MALDNRAYWDSLEEQPDGSIMVTFTVPELEVALNVVLGRASLATVLEPEALREMVRERAKAIVAWYESGKE